MKTKTLLTIFLFSIMSTFAQEDDDITTKKNYLTVNLMSSIVSYSPRWSLGYIRPITNKWYLGLEAGYGSGATSINFAKEADRITDRYRLFEIRPELFYVYDVSPRTKKYFSAELFYIHHKDNFLNQRYFVNNSLGDRTINYDSADYRRQKIGLNINFGLFIDLNQSIGFNVSTGLGIRHRHVEYSNLINPVETERDFEDDAYFNTTTYLENSGNHLGINYSFNVKFHMKI